MEIHGLSSVHGSAPSADPVKELQEWLAKAQSAIRLNPDGTCTVDSKLKNECAEHLRSMVDRPDVSAKFSYAERGILFRLANILDAGGRDIRNYAEFRGHLDVVTHIAKGDIPDMKNWSESKLNTMCATTELNYLSTYVQQHYKDIESSDPNRRASLANAMLNMKTVVTDLQRGFSSRDASVTFALDTDQRNKVNALAPQIQWINDHWSEMTQAKVDTIQRDVKSLLDSFL